MINSIPFRNQIIRKSIPRSYPMIQSQDSIFKQENRIIHLFILHYSSDTVTNFDELSQMISFSPFKSSELPIPFEILLICTNKLPTKLVSSDEMMDMDEPELIDYISCL